MIAQRMRAVVVLLFVFALGALAGIAFDRHHAPSLSTAPSPAALHEQLMAELKQIVGLDDQQVEQINAVMASHQEVVQHAWEQLRPEVLSAMREVHAQIAELLRPEQRQRFHEWLTGRLNQSQDEPAPDTHH